MSQFRDIYDKIYGSKEIVYEHPSGLLGFLYRKLKRFELNRHQAVYNLLPSGRQRLLDVGCGDGAFIFMAKDKFNECYGVDISWQRIEKAKEAAKRITLKKIAFYQCNVDEQLPFPESFFDVVTAIAVLEHVFNPPKVVEEIHRVLKPNGIFVAQVPNIAWIPNRIRLLFGKLPVTGGVYLGADWEHLHNFTKDTIISLLAEKDFRIAYITTSGIFYRFRRIRVSVLGGDLKAVKTKSHCAIEQ